MYPCGGTYCCRRLFHYNGMTFGEFVCAFVKSQILCARGRGFVSENFYYTALGRKERDDFD